MDLTGLSSVADFATTVINKIFPDPAQRDAAKLAMFQAQQAGEFKEMEQQFELAKAQIGVNAIEAASGSLFVSGGRPFILWICGVSLAYVGLVEPVMRFVATVVYKYAGTYPLIDTSITMQLLFGMLGLAGMRSFDKSKGVAAK
jgi:hypothetical protein